MRSRFINLAGGGFYDFLLPPTRHSDIRHVHHQPELYMINTWDKGYEAHRVEEAGAVVLDDVHVSLPEGPLPVRNRRRHQAHMLAAMGKIYGAAQTRAQELGFGLISLHGESQVAPAQEADVERISGSLESVLREPSKKEIKQFRNQIEAMSIRYAISVTATFYEVKDGHGSTQL